MDQVNVGAFIAQCRKEKQLTQAQLAEKLNITDRAVSKWETGKSMPDSSIMLELCEILGITVNELLSGEKISMENYDKKADENLIALTKKDENNLRKNAIISIIYSSTLIIGILVCAICDTAITGSFTWSLIANSSIIFAWVISFPFMILGKKGIWGSLISLSIFIIPYLYVLSRVLNVKNVINIGIPVSLISIVYLWIIFIICYRLRNRKFLATGIVSLLTIPFDLLVNGVVAKVLSEPVIDVDDILSAFILLILGFTFFVCDYARKKGYMK